MTWINVILRQIPPFILEIIGQKPCFVVEGMNVALSIILMVTIVRRQILSWPHDTRKFPDACADKILKTSSQRAKN